jgi:hypothetical protein
VAAKRFDILIGELVAALQRQDRGDRRMGV